MNYVGPAVVATINIGVAVAIPMVVSAMGFTAAGIAAGSLAAKMMSAAAIANGGGVAAGSTVAVLQSIGAAGLSLGTKVGLAMLGAAWCSCFQALLVTKPSEAKEVPKVSARQPSRLWEAPAEPPAPRPPS